MAISRKVFGHQIPHRGSEPQESMGFREPAGFNEPASLNAPEDLDRPVSFESRQNQPLDTAQAKTCDFAKAQNKSFAEPIPGAFAPKADSQSPGPRAGQPTAPPPKAAAARIATQKTQAENPHKSPNDSLPYRPHNRPHDRPKDRLNAAWRPPSVTVAVLGLAPSSEGNRKPDSLLLKTLLLAPEPSPGADSGLWRLPSLQLLEEDDEDLKIPPPASPLFNLLNMTIYKAVMSLPGVSPLRIERLEFILPKGADHVTCPYMALANLSGFKSSPSSGDFRLVSARLDDEALNVFIEGEGIKNCVVSERECLQEGRFKIENFMVSRSPLAPGHSETLMLAMRRLRITLGESDRIFSLMPESFSMWQLQSVYEAISGKKLHAPAFRRKLTPRLIPTDDFSKDKRFRPSRLFRYNPEWNPDRNLDW